MNKRREARRKRDREDFIRATTEAVKGYKLPHGISPPGACAGPSYREHLENELTRMAAKYQELADDPATPTEKLKAARGIVRGLAMALTLYEDSYNYSTQRVLKVEKDFL